MAVWRVCAIFIIFSVAFFAVYAVGQDTQPTRVPSAAALSSAPRPAQSSTPLPNSSSSAVEPFWRRASNFERLKQREILVSVDKQTVEGSKVLFRIRGAGLVSASRSHCFHASQEYEKLKEISEHFVQVKWDAPVKKLFMVLQALGYQARMILLMNPVSLADHDELRFEVIWGQFTGLKGKINFLSVTPRPGEPAFKTELTEMSIEAEFVTEHLPLPRSLMGLALEVVAQKVAEKMRSAIEGQRPPSK